ncbi:MAG: transcriptional regulator, winged helix family [Marmoricola sp.]|nr:transcriptional regulator, winged helix family [Marmoricola sp.]
MPPALTLLPGVRWNGEPVIGDRAQALLAALASSGRTERAEHLVGLVWGDEVPANPAKALQVLVSRTRTACAPEAVVRDGDGYRLGIAPAEVDSALLGDRVRAAAAAFDRDPATAAARAEEAISLGTGLLDPGDEGGPLADVRREGRGRVATARRIHARAIARMGDHEAALPSLEDAHRTDPDDEPLLADLLRSDAAVRGAASALGRYEDYRAGVRDRLGSDPGPELQRVHAELLALDSPVREGVRFEATTLLGRDQDVRTVHALLGTSRVVTVLGAGGLGKTRLAHVLGRQAPQPVVHMVELVSVTSPDDLIGEVGSSLGVRDSVSGRRALTPEQRSDVRARIAQHLDQAPSLLILDNCEHIVAAVADLVAYLVATTRSLTVLTTSRAPLAISAETVYPLGALGTADAVDLFGQRARAARPEVELGAAVTDIVERLDGLPLAIELAAAKVRIMSVSDIARRLENRFALLRGGDRSAPDRHQTLLAVIDWSWNLLGEPERQALRWLSVFHDGFTLTSAEAVLGSSALDAVQDLSDQSLLSVVESGGRIRYRMLETVREFGRMQLVDAGEDGAAREAQRRWSVELCRERGAQLFGADQIAAVAALHEEEGNLSDVLRQALIAPDAAMVVEVLAALGPYWSIRGDHARVIVLTDAVVEAVEGWTPPPHLEDPTRTALVITLNNGIIGGSERTGPLRDLVVRLGSGDGDPRIAAMVKVLLAFDPADLDTYITTMRTYGAGDDRLLAMLAQQMLSHVLENAGDPVGAVQAAERALELADETDGPWARAILHTQVAQLVMQAGDADSAVAHARQAIGTLEQLGALDDALQLRSMMALAAVGAGRLDRAERELEQLAKIDTESLFGGQLTVHLGEAELAFARGNHVAGLAVYRAAVDRVRTLQFPGMSATGLEPWILFGESTALTAYAYYGTAGDDEYAGQVAEASIARLAGALDPSFPYLDYPICGMVLFSLGVWGLLRGAYADQDAVRMLVLADRFAYNRTVPTMAWARASRVAEERAPGALARIGSEYAERRGPGLLAAARALVAQLSS